MEKLRVRRFAEEHEDLFKQMGDITQNIKDYRSGNSTGVFRAIGELANEFILAATLKRVLEADKEIGLRWLLFIRDHTSGYGLGERYVFRYMLRWMAQDANKRYINFKLLKLIVNKYGRWDDIFVLLGTDYQDMMFTIINETLERDKELVANGKYPSKLAKWLPSVNSKKQSGKDFVKAFCKYNKMKAKDYRKMLSYLRAKLDLLETHLTKKNFDGIYYTNYPNTSLSIHDKLLLKADPDRYKLFKRNRFLKYRPHKHDPIDLARYFDRRIKNIFVDDKEVENYFNSWKLGRRVDDSFQSIPHFEIWTEKENKYIVKCINSLLYSNTKKLQLRSTPRFKWSIRNNELKNTFPKIVSYEDTNIVHIIGFHRSMFKTDGFFDFYSENFLSLTELFITILSEDVYNI